MSLSQKCQYAVRAVLELSRRYQHGPIPASEVAASQAIPKRFLEVILNELKPSGLVESRRGAQGGYHLTRSPKDITIGQVIRLVEGPLNPVRCTGENSTTGCPLEAQCALVDVWNEAKEAIEKVYDSVTFQTLLDREEILRSKTAPNYSI